MIQLLNSNLIMTEATEESNCKELSFAPGEGRYPSDILLDKSWDINAFPLLHPNGKYGLNEKRETTVKLTDQSYFKQRFRNEDSRFIDNKAYLYYSVAYVERKQLQNNINLSLLHPSRVFFTTGTFSKAVCLSHLLNKQWNSLFTGPLVHKVWFADQ